MRWGLNPYSERYKTPPHKHQFTLTSVTVQADDRLKSLRRYVPARPEVGQRRAMNGEVLGYAMLVRTSNVASTHLGNATTWVFSVHGCFRDAGTHGRCAAMGWQNLQASEVRRPLRLPHGGRTGEGRPD
jgi:hypothetical protein